MKPLFFCSLVLVLLATSVSELRAASIPLTSIDVACPDNGPRFVLWIEGTDGECKETIPGVYECWEPGDDYAMASCDFACEKTVIENIAGCIAERTRPPTGPFAEPNFTVECDNGDVYELKGKEGDTCTQNDEGTPDNPNVTGGQCGPMQNSVFQSISTSVDCESGCGPSQVPADCKPR